MENSKPLHISRVHKSSIIVNKVHFFLHCTAVSFLIYYRAIFFLGERRDDPAFLWLVVFVAELILFAIWLLERPCRLRPISRTVFVERLPRDEKLPSIDVFVFTADPKGEPTLHVMNTVLSAMAMDYPPEKLHVYLSDDGGSELTLNGMREARRFARHWIPFCRRFQVAKRCPEAYFEGDDGRTSNGGLEISDEFLAEREKIYEKYQEFKESLNRFSETFEDNSGFSKTDHPSVIEVIQRIPEDEAALPSLIYVSREKRPSHHHYFKAGAINTLLRVSGVMTNSPFILGLDCDMHCNDPTSLRQAMCFHLDPEMSPTLAFVQFPHRFHTVARNDIYDSQLRLAFSLLWQGFDGLDGPVLSGTNYIIKRVALYGSYVQQGIDPLELKKYFGPSNEFIKSLSQQDKKPKGTDSSIAMLEEAKFLASCTYGSQTKWGDEVGFLRHSVTEDYLTSFVLKSRGWKSVYLSTSVPQFLGSGVTNLNDLLTQATRWSSGLFEVGISKFSPLTYRPSKMSFLERMCYAYLSFFPLFFLSLWCFSIIPQLCLLSGISLYPKVSSSFFPAFLFIFTSVHAHHLFDVFTTGGSFRAVMNELRMWMIKSVTSHMYGSLDAFMKRIGARKATFSLTNKAGDDERVELYQKGLYDFRSLPIFLVPIAFIVVLNVVAFFVGIGRAYLVGDMDEMFVQVFISFYILFINYPIIEGMVFRKDKGCFPKSVTSLSAVLVSMVIFLIVGIKFLIY